MNLRLTAGGKQRRYAHLLVVAVAMSVLILSTALVGTAAANVGCGDEITQNTTLTHDVGPCPGHGLVVTASNITLDLNGHRVFAANGPEETVGILLQDVTGVRVVNGVVEGFDAGISIEEGSGNTVRQVTARNNINDRSRNFDDPNDPNNCVYGDGILTFDSANNVIEHNRVIHNGPMSGIALVEAGSDGNRVSNNQVLDNNVEATATTPNPETGRPAGACGIPFAQRFQDVGIRIEGPGATNNTVRLNRVENSMLEGISIHGNVCRQDPRRPFIQVRPGNENNFVLNNVVRRNGTGQGPASDGIGILQQGPALVVCVASNNTIVENISQQNTRDGIFVGGRGSHDNEINRNVVNHNGRDGVHLEGPPRTAEGGPVIDPQTNQPMPGAINNTLIANRGHRNAQFDGADYNTDCDNNNWFRNRFGTVNQPCVAEGGTGTVGGPGRSRQARGQDQAQGPSNHRPPR